MAQAGYTPIKLFYSLSSGNQPTTGTLAYGELALNVPDGKLYYKNASGVQLLTQGNTAGSTFSTVTVTGSITASSNLGAIRQGTLGFSDTNIWQSYQTSVNSYAQVVMQNTNSGASASTDFVVTNNQGNSTTYYGNLGINSSGFTGTGSLNAANNVYVSATSSDLVLGTTTANAIRFVVNSGATDALIISSAGALTINGASTFAATGTFSNTAGNKLAISGNNSLASWTTTGPAISVAAGTYTSTGALTGTVVASSLGQPTFAAASGAVTNAVTLYIANAPTTSGTPTISNAYSLYIAAGASYFGGTVTLNNALLTGSGGTGLTSYTAGDLLYYASGTALSALAKGTTGFILAAGASAPNYIQYVPVANGGTGGTTQATARSGIGAAASGSNADITSIALTTGTISNAPSASTDIVNKLYADSIATGINFHTACQWATTVDLGTVTYNNGSSGVGATLTNAGTQAALVIDGHTFTSTDATNAVRVLIKNQTSSQYNGVYTVTNQGSASTNWVLTRATDYDTSGTGTNEIDQGDFVLIIQGTVNPNTSWVQQTALPITVGTTPISFAQFGSTTTVTSFSAGTTGLTPNSASSSAVTLAGTLITSNGGTGLSSYTAGDITYYASGTTFSKLALGANGSVLTAGASAPQYVTQSTLSVGSATTATNVAGGAAGSLIYQSGGSATTTLGIGTAGQALVVNSGATAPVWADQFLSITYIFSNPATSDQGDLTIPFTCTITEWTLLADANATANTVVDIWKVAYASYPATSGNVITASAKPTINSGSNKGQSSSLTGWTTTITAGDTLRFNVNSASGVARLTLSLKVKRT